MNIFSRKQHKTPLLSEHDLNAIPRQLNVVQRLGPWRARPGSGELVTEGRLVNSSVRVSAEKVAHGWSVSVVRTPRDWSDSRSTKPFASATGETPSDAFRLAIQQAKADLETEHDVKENEEE